jgi:elongation factor Ts
MVEVNSETDFVARRSFPLLYSRIALRIALRKYIRAEDIPADEVEEERSVARRRALEDGKPESVVERIVEGRLEKYMNEVVLLRQPYIRDDSLTIEDLLHQNIAAIGENLVIRRFVRWEVGGSAAAE